MKQQPYQSFFWSYFQVSLKRKKISEWRPENRTGVSGETGLMKSWPAGGPILLWSTLELAKVIHNPRSDPALYI